MKYSKGPSLVMPILGKSLAARSSPDTIRYMPSSIGNSGKSFLSPASAEGTPFIVPESEKNPSQSKRNFFGYQRSLAPLQNPNDTIPNLLKQVGSLSNEAVYSICQQLRINPPTHATLFQFVTELNSTDYNKLTTLQKAIANSVKTNLTYDQNGRLAHYQNRSTRPVNSYPFIDPRYSHSEEECSIMTSPIIIGSSQVDTSITLPTVNESKRIIIQSFGDNSIMWPTTLEIYANDLLIQGKTICRFGLIDVTQFSGGKIRIVCGFEQFLYSIVIRIASYQTYDDIVQKIKSRPNKIQLPSTNGGVCQALCPISGKIMDNPGRGINCEHAQCFDLKTYIQRSASSRQWLCPICGKPTNLDTLIYNQHLANEIAAACGSANSPAPDTFVMESPDIQDPDDGYLFDDQLFV